MQEMLDETQFAPAFMALWEELHAAQTPEARLVDDADKLEMFVQALVYEQQTGNVQLEQFWARPYTFNFPQAQAIYDKLRSQRA